MLTLCRPDLIEPGASLASRRRAREPRSSALRGRPRRRALARRVRPRRDGLPRTSRFGRLLTSSQKTSTSARVVWPRQCFSRITSLRAPRKGRADPSSRAAAPLSRAGRDARRSAIAATARLADAPGVAVEDEQALDHGAPPTRRAKRVRGRRFSSPLPCPTAVLGRGRPCAAPTAPPPRPTSLATRRSCARVRARPPRAWSADLPARPPRGPSVHSEANDEPAPARSPSTPPSSPRTPQTPCYSIFKRHCHPLDRVPARLRRELWRILRRGPRSGRHAALRHPRSRRRWGRRGRGRLWPQAQRAPCLHRCGRCRVGVLRVRWRAPRSLGEPRTSPLQQAWRDPGPPLRPRCHPSPPAPRSACRG